MTIHSPNQMLAVKFQKLKILFTVAPLHGFGYSENIWIQLIVNSLMIKIKYHSTLGNVSQSNWNIETLILLLGKKVKCLCLSISYYGILDPLMGSEVQEILSTIKYILKR